MKKTWIAGILAVSMLIQAPVMAMQRTEDFPQTLDIGMERLGRGLVCVSTNNGVYLSWRLLGTEPMNTVFAVYRDGVRIPETIESTNYLDTEGTSASTYQVAAIIDEQEQELCETAQPLPSGTNYLDIPIEAPEDMQVPVYVDETTDEEGNTIPAHWAEETCYYSAGDASCADLDGDGEYEIVLKWDPSNAKDSESSGYTGNAYLDAYKLDGTRLWRVDLGKNVRAGAHYTQFTVYDLDGDGKAEMVCKTAPGSKDNAGNYVSDVSDDMQIRNTDNDADYRAKNGRVHASTTDKNNIIIGDRDGNRLTECPEFFTVFSGETGEALDTVWYPAPTGNDVKMWGDRDGNRADRYLACVAYLDGIHPYAVTWRGYYPNREGLNGIQGRTAVNAFRFENGKLRLEQSFDTYEKAQYGYTPGNEAYIGQGNHNLTVGDVDGDGRDEIISGALCLDNDFSVKWCSYMGHGDALHMQNYDPTRKGYEYFTVHESETVNPDTGFVQSYGMSVHDAATGEVLSTRAAGSDTGRGVMANIGAGGYYQAWGSGTVDSNDKNISLSGQSYNFRIYWDGDLYDELLDGTVISKYNQSTKRFDKLLTANECTSVNGTKAVPALQADLFGDWREEVVFPTTDRKSLRVFTTNIPTEYKMPVLMHDRMYREAVAWQNTGYNQPPHVGFYLGEPIERTADVELNNPLVQKTRTPEYGVLGVIEGTYVNIQDGALDVRDGTVGIRIEPSTQKAVTSFDFNVQSGTYTMDLRDSTRESIHSDDWQNPVLNTAYTNSDIRIVTSQSGSGVRVIRRPSANKWYHTEIITDYETKTAVMTISDAQTGEVLGSQERGFRNQSVPDYSRATFVVSGKLLIKNWMVTENGAEKFNLQDVLDAQQGEATELLVPAYYCTQTYQNEHMVQAVSVAQVRDIASADKKMLAAVYDTNGVMKQLKTVELDGMAKNIAQKITLGLAWEEGDSIKLFFWNGQTYEPYAYTENLL